jgi:transcriptional regulator with XRE-family HTH domain
MILIVGIDMRKEELIKLGQIVRNKRIQRNLTQTELSTRAKVDRNYIGMLERGERNPSYLSLLKIASGLDMSINELLTI